jgi:hypothetical protein
MHQLHAALAQIRNNIGSLSGRGALFWAVTVLIALLVPSPIAAPVLYARLRRGPPPRPSPDAP